MPSRILMGFKEAIAVDSFPKWINVLPYPTQICGATALSQLFAAPSGSNYCTKQWKMVHLTSETSTSRTMQRFKIYK
ncbi:hypothetical protein VULLAG_LOCUS16697 [Vulpes lagopus]